MFVKNHISLIITLCKKHKVQEANTALDALFQDLYPKQNNKELYNAYYERIYEMCIYFYDDETLGIRSILKKLENLSVEVPYEPKLQIILLYKKMIVRVIKENDVKLLSDLCYSAAIIGTNKNSTNNNQNVNMMLRSINELMDSSAVEEENIKKAKIFVFLQAALKSVELSYYSCTGFIVKFLVTTFKSESLKEVFTQFYNEPFENTLIDHVDGTVVDSSFNFNIATLKYCQLKLGILLYGQQVYVKEHNIGLGEIPSEQGIINELLLSCTYPDYVFGKIEKAESKYGLLFLTDGKFMEKMREKLYPIAVH
jgi:hypothetical protein